ncbi:MAG: IPT/TIG domain-containing protein, partial [Bacteroidota bacterium]|nr:IPT/TIG domain-containing protein [Bacteroidota bacterium]
MVARNFLGIGSLYGIVIFGSFSCTKNSNPNNHPVNNSITISSLRPTHGPYDTVDTLTGKGFDQIAAFDSVLVNGRKLTVISRTDEQVIVKIPSMAGTGHVEIWYQGEHITGPVFTYDSLLMVTTVAGSATEFGRVDAKGLDARFYQLAGIAVDHSGNIYVSDGGSTIRKIDTAANVTTFAGALN